MQRRWSKQQIWEKIEDGVDGAKEGVVDACDTCGTSPSATS